MKIAVGALVLLILATGAWMWISRPPDVRTDEFGFWPMPLFDKPIHLDAESLAEHGIGKAYVKVDTYFRLHAVRRAPIQELIDESGRSYVVRFRDVEYVIYSPQAAGSAENSWGRASFAFFTVINQQLPTPGPRFYAIGSGHDLRGMFLTAEEVAQTKASSKRPEDWPYIPTQEAPWFGQAH